MKELGEDIYTKHLPVVVDLMDPDTGDVIREYHKHEEDDNFLFRKTRSVSINATVLERCDRIRIAIAHREVVIVAQKNVIKEFQDVKTFNGEVKYYYPVERWQVVAGDVDWVRKLNS